MSSYSLAQNLIFIHPPKTAGTSIRSALGAFIDDMMDFEQIDAADRDATGRIRDEAFANHLPLYGIEGLIEAALPTHVNFVANARKVLAVRNPWERMVSLYFHRKKKLHLVAPDGRPRNREADIQAVEAGFSHWLLETPHPGDRVLTRTPCAAWGKNRQGVYSVDFLIRFDGLANDWMALCRTLGIGDVGLPHILRGTGESTHYRDFYDARTCEHVETYFAEDIERFGYSF